MQQQARAVRSLYSAMEKQRYGREWSHEELMLGFMGNVGDLAKLVQGKAGVRQWDELDVAVAHELADCLWSVLSLADAYGVDLEIAFSQTMEAITKDLSRARGFNAPSVVPPVVPHWTSKTTNRGGDSTAEGS